MELVRRPATQLAALVAAGEVSPREVYDAHVAAIDPAVNAVVAVADFAEPCDSPLRGVPFTVKDNIAVAGLPLVAGVPERRGGAHFCGVAAIHASTESCGDAAMCRWDAYRAALARDEVALAAAFVLERAA